MHGNVHAAYCLNRFEASTKRKAIIIDYVNLTKLTNKCMHLIMFFSKRDNNVMCDKNQDMYIKKPWGKTKHICVIG